MRDRRNEQQHSSPRYQLRLTAILLALGVLVTGLVATPEAARAGVIAGIDVAPVWSVHETGAPVLLSTPSYQYVAYYDANKYLTLAQRSYSSSTWTYHQFGDIQTTWQTGAHHAIAMSADSAGRIHISAAMHNEALKYYRMTAPDNMNSFVKVTSLVGTNETYISYPEFFKDAAGSLYYSYRDGGSGNGFQVTDRFDAATGGWTRLPTILDGTAQGESAYIRGPLLGPDGYFHLVWMWRITPDVSTNHDMNYARSKDLIHWETASGTPVSLPMTPSTSATTFDPAPSNSGLINSADYIGFDSSNMPVIDYVKYDSSGNSQIYDARYSAGAWQIVPATDWKWRWNIAGSGAISPDITITAPVIGASGQLNVDFTNKMYGAGRIALSESTLRPTGLLTSQEVPRLWPRQLDAPETVNPPRPMTVQWVQDIGTPPAGQQFSMRWEHGPSNGDSPVAQPWPDPTMLRVYSLNPSTEGGTTNLAAGRKASASSSYETSAWGVAHVTDGALFPTSSVAGYSSNSSPSANHVEWVSVDLGASYSVSQISLLPAPGNEGMPVDFSLQVSPDGSSWTTVVSRSNAPVQAGEQTFAFSAVNGRFVRLYATSLRPLSFDGNKYRLQLNEILVGGAPDLAASSMVSATSTYETTAWSLARLNDGDVNAADDGWTSNSQLTSNHSESVTVDFGASKQVASVDLYPAAGGNFFPLNVEIETSTDGSTWTQVSNANNVPIPSDRAHFAFAAQVARFVRVTGTALRQWSGDSNYYRMQLAEIEVMP